MVSEPPHSAHMRIKHLKLPKVQSWWVHNQEFTFQPFLMTLKLLYRWGMTGLLLNLFTSSAAHSAGADFLDSPDTLHCIKEKKKNNTLKNPTKYHTGQGEHQQNIFVKTPHWYFRIFTADLSPNPLCPLKVHQIIITPRGQRPWAGLISQ